MRWASILLVFWSTVAMPSLCMGGWLTHSCAPCEPVTSSIPACARGPVAHCDDREDTPGHPPVLAEVPACTPSEQPECGHESGCIADPCSPLLRVNQEDSGLDLHDDDLALDVPILPDSLTGRHLAISTTNGVGAQQRMTQPYPVRALPLLL